MSAVEHFREAWVVPNPEGGETGVLLRFGQPGRRHWYLVCPAAATLYFEQEPDFEDCQIGFECDFLDTVHAEAVRLARAVNPCGFTFPTPGGLAAECDLPSPCPVHVTGGSTPNPTEPNRSNAQYADDGGAS